MDKNYLDFIPVPKTNLKFEIDEKKAVTIFQENKGFMNFIAQKLFKRPRVSQIHLDEMGNFIWPHLDGKNTVYDIAQLVHEEFKEKADPLYDRLVTYIDTLERYGFIQITNRK